MLSVWSFINSQLLSIAFIIASFSFAESLEYAISMHFFQLDSIQNLAAHSWSRLPL